jgi:hypothetical protein
MAEVLACGSILPGPQQSGPSALARDGKYSGRRETGLGRQGRRVTRRLNGAIDSFKRTPYTIIAHNSGTAEEMPRFHL